MVDIKFSDLCQFLPKQNAAFERLSAGDYVLYGGSRGPGKSYWLRWSGLAMLLYWAKLGYKGVKIGLFCETFPLLRDRQISKIELEFPTWLGKVKETMEDGLCFFLHEDYGAGKIALRNLDDASKYQSAEFAGILVDEITKNSYNTFEVLRGSKRWPGINRTFFGAATNPGGIGHAWVKQLWIDRDFPKELRPMANRFAFFQALPKDNPYLSQEYWDELNTLSPDLRRAWVDGDWDIFAGMALPNWRRDKHVIEPFELPAHWPRWRAVDWGYAAPFCCLWFAINPDNRRVIVYREAYHTGLTEQEQARLIVALTLPEEFIGVNYADPALWTVKTMEGRVWSTAEEYAENGVPLSKANNDRLGGKRRVDQALADLPDGKPGLLVFSNCVNLIRTLPALPRDEHNPEDVDSNAEDHAYDTLRYGLTHVRLHQDAYPKAQQQQRSPYEYMRNI